MVVCLCLRLDGDVCVHVPVVSVSVFVSVFASVFAHLCVCVCAYVCVFLCLRVVVLLRATPCMFIRLQ